MNKLLKGIIAGSLLLVGGANANAGIINFSSCWSSCANISLTPDNVGVPVGAVLATLQYDQAGADVNFVLTNTIGNLYPGNTTTFLSQLFFNIGVSIAESAIVNESANIDAIDIGVFTNASLNFDVDAELQVSGGPGNLRLTNGETASWTFLNFTAANVLTPAMVHFQSLPNGQSVKITQGGGGGCNPDIEDCDEPFPVPEPGMLVLLGSALMGLGLAKKRKAKA